MDQSFEQDDINSTFKTYLLKIKNGSRNTRDIEFRLMYEK